MNDNATNRRILHDVLTRWQLRTHLAENASHAVQAWQEGGFDLILRDIQMPEMNGFEATAAIREREKATGGPHSHRRPDGTRH